MATTEADNLPPLSSGRFSYGATSGFRFDNVPRISPAELQEMFTHKRRQSAANMRGYKLSKKEIEAQFRLYGVSCSELRSMRVGEMREMIANMVKEGKLNAPTAEAAQLEASLRGEYDALNKPHITSLSRMRQAKFDAITDPSKAAEFSIPLFLQRYFLNVDGMPNLTKTPDPIALPGFSNRSMMHSAAEKIPGLHTWSAGDEPYRVLAIGWDRSAVARAAGKAAAAGYQQWALEMDRERTTRMSEHLKFLENLRGKKKGTKKTVKKEFNINHATGRYLVECKDIEDEWPDQAQGGLYLNIVPDEENKGRTVAEFDFGMLEGIMRFHQAGEEPLPNGDLRDTDEDSEEESSSEEEEDDIHDDEDANPTLLVSGKRKRSKAKSPPKPQPKKPHLSPTGKFKLLFHWRGRETSEGVIQVDYHQSNKGYIEFENSDCTTFTGLMDSEYFTKAKLRGYKVAGDDGRGIDVAWEDFSEEAYEIARVSRWH